MDNRSIFIISAVLAIFVASVVMLAMNAPAEVENSNSNTIENVGGSGESVNENNLQ